MAYQLLSAPPFRASQVAEVPTQASHKPAGCSSLPCCLRRRHGGQYRVYPVLGIVGSIGRAIAHARYHLRWTHRDAVAHLSFRYGPVENASSEAGEPAGAFHGGAGLRVHGAARRKETHSSGCPVSTSSIKTVYPLEVGPVPDMTFEEAHDWLDFLNFHVAEFGGRIRNPHRYDFPDRLATSSGVFDAEFEGIGIDCSSWPSRCPKSTSIGAISRRCWTPWSQSLLHSGHCNTLAEEGDQLYFPPLADGRHFALSADRCLPWCWRFRAASQRQIR